MISRRKVRHGLWIIILVASAGASFAQTQRLPSGDNLQAAAAKLYANAHPYLDAPFSEQKKAVPQLSGMTPASSQEQLPSLLDKVGNEAYDLLQNVPDLVSDEAVSQARYVIPERLVQPAGAGQDETFDYLILRRPGAFGQLSESRTTRRGNPVDQTAGAPNYEGFLPAWVLFYPVNQVESRFRFLGEQQVDGHDTFVIGFAQLPSSMSSLARPVLLQGIAWVDQSDFRIVRLHTDLLAPLPEKNLLKQTADIVFGPVEISQANLHLWLPAHVDFAMEANSQFFHEQHKYLDYRLYKRAADQLAEQITPSPAPSSPAVSEEAKGETKLYADAHPYMDESFSELTKDVHDLSGLTPSPNQDALPDLLAKTGAHADALLNKLPNLISDEAVSESHYSKDTADGCVGTGCISQGAVVARDELFHYMILTHRTQDGQLKVSEYRTTRNDKPVGSGAAGAPMFQGFVSAWIALSSANQPESHFRYLGEQRVNGHATYVLGFAQIPGSVESPGEVVVNGESFPMLLQGIAWVDQSDFRIVRLRTDLLAPLPLILLRTQTETIAFGPVRIASLDSDLWLPKIVKLQMDVRGQVVREKHSYSKYRLYQAKTKILLSPGDEPAEK